MNLSMLKPGEKGKIRDIVMGGVFEKKAHGHGCAYR